MKYKKYREITNFLLGIESLISTGNENKLISEFYNISIKLSIINIKYTLLDSQLDIIFRISQKIKPKTISNKEGKENSSICRQKRTIYSKYFIVLQSIIKDQDEKRKENTTKE